MILFQSSVPGSSDRIYWSGLMTVQQISVTTLAVRMQANGNITSCGSITTLWKDLDASKTLFNRQVLLNNAENATVNPMDKSHGVAMQAASLAYCVLFSPS
mmetsp:Transcript_28795/g.52107  ORF Transcript_28795/g.52107 Transcript_28795/m.52107 type:complete len:101 (-) Transcript_28795:1095-1397(-)